MADAGAHAVAGAGRHPVAGAGARPVADAVVREPTATDLLTAWERGLAGPPLERPLALLSAFRPDRSPAALAALPVGRRDAELLALRRAAFGPAVAGFARCPSCGERLEMAFGVQDVTVDPEGEGDLREAYRVEAAGHSVAFRLATSADLLAVQDAGAGAGTDVPEARAVRRRLLERCVLEASSGGVAVPAGALPEEAVAAVAERMAGADPQADVELDVRCPACGHGWREPFDIASFLWEELDGWARRTLRDVAALARAYGWSEAEILRMGPARRRAYLELAAEG